MSPTTHTPGPWAFSRWERHGDVRFYIAQQDGAPYTPDFSDVATLIAETVSIERFAVQEANARLIAAAPELLVALKAVLASLDWHTEQHGNVGLDAQRKLDARAVIAKVEGVA